MVVSRRTRSRVGSGQNVHWISHGVGGDGMFHRRAVEKAVPERGRLFFVGTLGGELARG